MSEEVNGLTSLVQEVKENYKGKVVLFTMFYKQHAYPAHTRSLVQTVTVLEKLGIKWDYADVTGEGQPARSINQYLTSFMESDATDFINIDSDISWDCGQILRLLWHPEEIVAATYRKTNKPDDYVGMIALEEGRPKGKVLKDGTALLETDMISGGFMRIKKSALQKFVDFYPDRHYQSEGKKVLHFFGDAPIVNNEFTSGDSNFSILCKNAGIGLWTDPNIHLGHWNFFEFKGNFDKFLRNPQSEEKIKEAFQIIKDMANNDT